MLLDIERIAPCLPGAELQEVEGDEYRGVVKVKVGPITAQYKGTAKLAEVDEAAHRIVLDASGRDTRGQGNAKAKIVVTMAEDGDGTNVDVATDLSITGKVAQFGRGVLGDVSAKLLGQFVENLERDVLERAATGARRGRRGRATRATPTPAPATDGAGVGGNDRRAAGGRTDRPPRRGGRLGGTKRLIPVGDRTRRAPARRSGARSCRRRPPLSG